MCQPISLACCCEDMGAPLSVLLAAQHTKEELTTSTPTTLTTVEGTSRGPHSSDACMVIKHCCRYLQVQVPHSPRPCTSQGTTPSGVEHAAVWIYTQKQTTPSARRSLASKQTDRRLPLTLSSQNKKPPSVTDIGGQPLHTKTPLSVSLSRVCGAHSTHNQLVRTHTIPALASPHTPVLLPTSSTRHCLPA